MDSTTHILMANQNNAGYVPVISAASVAGADTQVQYNNSGAFGASADFTWTNSTHVLALGNAGGGIAVSSTSVTAVAAASGGMSAKILGTTQTLRFTEDTAGNAGLSTAGNTRFYMDSTTHIMMVSQDGAAYVPLVASASVAGSNKQLQYNNSGSFGGAVGLEWDNGTTTLTFGSSALLNVLGTSTAVIQAAAGGVTAKKLIATTYIDFAEDTAANAGAGAAGHTKIYMDSTTHIAMISQNGAAYIPLINASGTVAGSNTHVQYNNSGVFGASSDLTWNNTSHVLEMHNVGGTILSDSTSAFSFSSPAGGVNAKWLYANDSLFFVEEPAPSLSLVGQSRIYMDSTSHTLKASLNGGAYVSLINSGGTPAGSDTWVQFNDGGSFGAVSSFYFTKASSLLVAGAYVSNTGGTGINFRNAGSSFSVDGNGQLVATNLFIGANQLIDSAGNIIAPSGATIKATATGASIGFLLANSNFLVSGNGNVGMAGNVGIGGVLDVTGVYKQNGTGTRTVINSSGAFVGPGVNVGPVGGVGGRAFNPYDSGGTLFNGQDILIGFNQFTFKLTYNGSDISNLKFVGGIAVAAS